MALSGIAFSKDGKKVVHVDGLRHNLAVTTISTGETIFEDDSFATDLCLDTNKQIILGNFSLLFTIFCIFSS